MVDAADLDMTGLVTQRTRSAPKSERRLPTALRRMRMGAENALELLRLGRLTTRAGAPYELTHQGPHHCLRHYRSGATQEIGQSPLLLVPPLMMTAEIYDVAPDNSAVRTLMAGGVDTWVVDFGAPESIEGGMDRTLDDHVRAVAEAVDQVQQATGKEVHLGGYSQGGMFAYQAAALRQSGDLASVITFGSPVDIHRNLPQFSTDLTARIIRAWRPLVEPLFARLEGLPGALTSTGFKLFSLRKEVAQLAEFLSLLHDRRALEKREGRRRFLGGEGFVAWPGPALMKFIDEFVVHNRMMSGGFVIDGQSVTLADIRCPLLVFVGGRDDIARPPSVRAVRQAVLSTEIFEVTLPAGHFGLVAGSLAMRDTWPTVIDWIHWRQGAGRRPRLLSAPQPTETSDEVEDAAFNEPLDFELFYDAAARIAQSGLKWLNDSVEDAGDAADQLRYQLPRLLRLRRLTNDTRINLGLELNRQARAAGTKTCFLYRGRAVTYAEADARVDRVVRGLLSVGVRPEDRVGVLMGARPSFLSVVCALGRLGAVAVLLKPETSASTLEHSLAICNVAFLCADPEHVEAARRAFAGTVLVFGGGSREQPLTTHAVDMETVDPDAVQVPAWYVANPGRAEDLALIFASAGRTDKHPAQITNRRWAFSAIGAAAACTLTTNDTVYSCLPLHHPAGLLVSAGAALVSGARLALASRFEPEIFWDEVRRSGATVAFYANELCRDLADAPNQPRERTHPLRLLAGSGMRLDVWKRITQRFNVGVLEFYAATEVSAVLANASGRKPGSLGRPLPGSHEIFLAAWDSANGRIVRDSQGRAVRSPVDEVGVLLARLDGAPRALRDPSDRIVTNVLAPGDRWFSTRDLLRRDADGDYWFVDSLRHVIATSAGATSSRPVEDAAYGIEAVKLCAAYGQEIHGVPTVVLAIVEREAGRLHSTELDAALLRPTLTPTPVSYVRVVRSIPLSDGFRPVKQALRTQDLQDCERLFEFDPVRHRYVARDDR